MSFLLHLAIITAINIPPALGYNLIFGKGRILHFGPVAVGLGSVYACYLTLLATGSYPLAAAAGFMMAAALSLLFALLSLRLTQDGLGILSLAVHLAVLSVVLNWSSLTRGALGISRIPRIPGLETQEAFALAAALHAIAWTVFFLSLHRSALGRKLSALSEQHWHAEGQGISRRNTSIVAFLIGGTAIAAGNMLFPQYLHLLSPADYGFQGLVLYLMIVVAGKPGSVPGVVLATILIMLLREGVRFLPIPVVSVGPVRLLLFGGILLAAVWWRKEKLFPVKRSV